MMAKFLSKLRLPKLLSRSRWERIRMALDAYPRMIAILEAQRDEAQRRHADALQASRLMEIEREDGGRLIQAVVKY